MWELGGAKRRSENHHQSTRGGDSDTSGTSCDHSKERDKPARRPAHRAWLSASNQCKRLLQATSWPHRSILPPILRTEALCTPRFRSRPVRAWGGLLQIGRTVKARLSESQHSFASDCSVPQGRINAIGESRVKPRDGAPAKGDRANAANEAPTGQGLRPPARPGCQDNRIGAAPHTEAGHHVLCARRPNPSQPAHDLCISLGLHHASFRRST